MPAPLQPRKPAAVWLYRWAEAVQHLETFEAFLSDPGNDVQPFAPEVAA